MRRLDRAVVQYRHQLEILRQCSVLRLAMMDEKGLYIVPLSFGYTERDGKLSFYIHSAKEGRKASAMAGGCPVAFEMDCCFQLQQGEIPCKYSCKYASLIGNGRAVPVEDPQEKALGLSVIMRHQSGKEFCITEKMTETVAVFRIDVEEMTGKKNL